METYGIWYWTSGLKDACYDERVKRAYIRQIKMLLACVYECASHIKLEFNHLT